MMKRTGKTQKYLSEQSLENLKDHKYSCNGRSLIEPAFQKFWNWLIEFMPSRIAPNTLTLVGLIANVASIILISIQFGSNSNIPAWSLCLCAFGLFFYQTLDALDGKQARKTNTCSHLGELFDHGCDAISSNFVVLGNILAIGMFEYPCLSFIHFFMTVVDFYLAHWQTYVTGTLEFGKLDVTESQLAVTMVYLASAVFGVEFWDGKMPFFDLEWKIFHFIIMFIGGITIGVRYIRVILKGGCGRHGATIANTSILFPFCPIALVVSMATVVAIKSPNQIYQSHPVLFLMSFGMVACKVTQKLVVAHMTKSELTLFDNELIGPSLLILNQYLFNSYFDEYLILWLCLILSSYCMLKYATNVCLQIADFLNIYIFSVDKPAPRPPSNNAVPNTSFLFPSGNVNSSSKRHSTSHLTYATEYGDVSSSSNTNSNVPQPHIKFSSVSTLPSTTNRRDSSSSSTTSSATSFKSPFKNVNSDKIKLKKKDI